MLQQPIALVQGIGVILNLLIPTMVAAAVVVFFYGLVKYIMSSGKGYAQGKNVMIAGIVSIFIMVSLWGIISYAGGALGITPGNTNLVAPTVSQ